MNPYCLMVDRLNPLQKLRQKLDAIEITDRQMADWICRSIPARCPFERRVQWFGRVLHIPPLCRFNPVYGQLVALRLRAMTYLINEMNELPDQAFSSPSDCASAGSGQLTRR